MLWALAAAPARAQDVGIFQLFVNLQPKGDVYVVHPRGDEYWMKTADLEAAGLARAAGETRAFSGVPHVRVDTLPGVVLDVDDRELTISITAKPELLGSQRFDLRGTKPIGITPSLGNSAHVNYRIGYQRSAGQPEAYTWESQWNARLGPWLLRYQDTYASDLPDHRYVRQTTNLIRDWPDTMQRLDIGDATALSGELGTTRMLTGVTFSRIFDMQPSFVSNPTARIVGTVPLPSTAEIYVDGVRVRTQRVNPGSFQFDNLDYYGGLRRTEIVIRDPYGVRQVLARAFYFSDQLLKAGLHDYSYSVGVERENVGVRSNDYSGRAWSAYHRYGWSDTLTIGVRSDGNREAYSAGPVAGVLLGRYGILGAAYSARRNVELDRTGHAGLARYTFESRRWTVRAQVRKADLEYSLAAADPANRALPRRDTLFGIGYNSTRYGSASFDDTRSRFFDGTFRDAKTFGYSLGLNNAVQFFFSASHVKQETGRGWEGFVGLSASFEGARQASVARQKIIGEGYVETAEYSKTVPDGEGYGYRLGLEHARDGTVFEPFGQVNLRHFVVTGNGSFKAAGDPAGSDQAGVSVAGAVVLAGGAAALTRPVPTSFAVVRVGDVDDVRVYRNQQEVGRTDRGTLVVPNLSAYSYNRISVAPEDVPMSYALTEVDKTLVPMLGSGVLAAFDARPIRVYESSVRVRDDQGVRAVENVSVTLKGAERELTVVSGPGGRLYLDGVAPGSYAGTFATAGSICRFALTLPATSEATTRLPPMTAECTPARR